MIRWEQGSLGDHPTVLVPVGLLGEAADRAATRPALLRPGLQHREEGRFAVGGLVGLPQEVGKGLGLALATGLGLSLVYSIASQETLGLSVESEPGKGAQFTLVIPTK